MITKHSKQQFFDKNKGWWHNWCTIMWYKYNNNFIYLQPWEDCAPEAANKEKYKPSFDSIDNPGQWSKFTFLPKLAWNNGREGTLTANCLQEEKGKPGSDATDNPGLWSEFTCLLEFTWNNGGGRYTQCRLPTWVTPVHVTSGGKRESNGWNFPTRHLRKALLTFFIGGLL